jgi:putative tricarboxylic transport membrane protein
MKFNDAISGALLLALGIAILLAVRSYPAIPGQSVGPSAFPGLLAILLIVCALILMVNGIRARASQPWFTGAAWLKSAPHVLRFGATCAALIFYIIAADKLGFLLCGSLILAALFWLLDVKRAWILPVAIGMTLFIHLVFYKGLRVPLPWGVLPVLY